MVPRSGCAGSKAYVRRTCAREEGQLGGPQRSWRRFQRRNFTEVIRPIYTTIIAAPYMDLKISPSSTKSSTGGRRIFACRRRNGGEKARAVSAVNRYRGERSGGGGSDVDR